MIISPRNISRFYLRAYNHPPPSPAMDFDQVYSTRNEFSSGEQASLRSTLSRLCHNSHTIIVPVVKSCLPQGQYCSMQGPVLGKTINVFSLPVACIAHSSIMKASQQGGSFLVFCFLLFDIDFFYFL